MSVELNKALNLHNCGSKHARTMMALIVCRQYILLSLNVQNKRRRRQLAVESEKTLRIVHNGGRPVRE